MNKAQQKRFDSLYRKHLSALKRQGKADSTRGAFLKALSEAGVTPPARPRNGWRNVSAWAKVVKHCVTLRAICIAA
jgi:hypothetical protein